MLTGEYLLLSQISDVLEIDMVLQTTSLTIFFFCYDTFINIAEVYILLFRDKSTHVIFKYST